MDFGIYDVIDDGVNIYTKVSENEKSYNECDNLGIYGTLNYNSGGIFKIFYGEVG